MQVTVVVILYSAPKSNLSVSDDILAAAVFVPAKLQVAWFVLTPNPTKLVTLTYRIFALLGVPPASNTSRESCPLRAGGTRVIETELKDPDMAIPACRITNDKIKIILKFFGSARGVEQELWALRRCDSCNAFEHKANQKMEVAKIPTMRNA